MAEKLGEIYVEVKTKTDKLKKDFKDLEKKGQKSGNKIATAFKAAKGMIIGFGISLVGAIGTLKKFTSMAIQQEEIYKKMQTSIELTGQEWGKAEKELSGLFATLQATTQYGDTDSAQMLTTLVQLTGDYKKSVAALPMVLDLASTGLFDQGTAARYIALALEGNVEMLGRYIPELRAANNEIVKNGSVAEKTAEFMRIFNEKFAGTAQKNLNSTAGQLKQVKNYLGDMAEKIGDSVIPVVLKVTESLA